MRGILLAQIARASKHRRQFFELGVAGGHTHDEFVHFILIEDRFETVVYQNGQRRHESCAFVAIEERMIPHNEEAIASRLVEDSWETLDTEYCRLRLGNARSRRPTVSNPGHPAEQADNPVVNLDKLSLGKVERRICTHLIAKSSQEVFVVGYREFNANIHTCRLGQLGWAGDSWDVVRGVKK